MSIGKRYTMNLKQNNSSECVRLLKSLPIIKTVSFAIANILQPNPLMLALYIKLVTFGGAVLLFWTDVIPGIGMVSQVRSSEN